MKFKLLAAAVALGCVGTANAVDVVISGATASGDIQRNKIISDLCGGTAINYRVPADNDFWAVGCTPVKPASATGAPHVFYKAGLGSGFGVSPVDTGTALEVVDISTCSLNDDTATPTVTEYDCALPSTNFTLVPEIGFSDVEPAAFRGDLAPPTSAGGAYDGDGLVSEPVFGLVFGIIISENFRDTLQNAQGLTVGSELEVDMPSLSAQHIRSLKSGRINLWSQVDVDENGIQGINGYRNDLPGVGIGLAGGAANDIVTYNVGDAVTDGRVHICRRAPGSGTLAQYAMQFHRTNCAAGTVGVAVANNYLPTSVTIRMVSQPQGSSDMGKCVADTAGPTLLAAALKPGSATPESYSVPSGQTFNVPARTTYSIGHQSLEKNDQLSRAYRFVKVDGEAPTCANVHAGKYWDFAESTLNRQITAPSNIVDIFNELVASFADDGEIACDFDHVSFGKSGLMGIPSATQKPLATWVDSLTPADNSVNAFTHLGNTCQPPIIYASPDSMLVN